MYSSNRIKFIFWVFIVNLLCCLLLQKSHQRWLIWIGLILCLSWKRILFGWQLFSDLANRFLRFHLGLHCLNSLLSYSYILARNMLSWFTVFPWGISLVSSNIFQMLLYDSLHWRRASSSWHFGWIIYIWHRFFSFVADKQLIINLFFLGVISWSNYFGHIDCVCFRTLSWSWWFTRWRILTLYSRGWTWVSLPFSDKQIVCSSNTVMFIISYHGLCLICLNSHVNKLVNDYFINLYVIVFLSSIWESLKLRIDTPRDRLLPAKSYKVMLSYLIYRESFGRILLQHIFKQINRLRR